MDSPRGSSSIIIIRRRSGQCWEEIGSDVRQYDSKVFTSKSVRE